MVKSLLAKGANVNHIAVNTMSALLLAARKGYLEIVNVLLAHNANVNHENVFENTALIWAAKKGYLEIVKSLLAKLMLLMKMAIML